VQCLLWSESAVLIDPAASKETVMHHALGKQKTATANQPETGTVQFGTRATFPLQGLPYPIS